MKINWTAMRQTADAGLQRAKLITPMILPVAAAIYFAADSFSVKLLAGSLFIDSFGYQATSLCLKSLSYFRIKMNLQAWCNERKGTPEYERRIEAARKIETCISSRQKELNLSGLRLTSLPSAIGELQNLDTLDLHDNQLTVIPLEIRNLIDLEFLYLNDNQITDLPREIGNLVTLLALNLQNNHLTAFPPEIGNLVNLFRLNLGNNSLTVIPPEIGNLVNLQDLYLGGNQITDLPPEIGNLVTLRVLDLQDNHLTDLPSEIGNLVTLVVLNLQDNHLTDLPSEIRNLVHLMRLNLSNNHLTAPPPVSENLLYFQRLLLNNNPCTMPQTDFTQLVVDTEELSKDPAKVLMSLIDHVDRENSFPRIRYNTSAGIDELGVDAGGITRDFVTGLCKALGQPPQQSLPMIYNETGAMPTIDESFEKRTVQEQKKCWQALGLIFAQGLQNYRSIRTGHLFCFSVFQMMHALSNYDINQIPEDATSCANIPPNVYKKLLRAFLQTEFSSAFPKRYELEAFLTKGRIPNSIKDLYGNAKEFTEEREIDKIIFALAVIAKATTKHLRRGMDWDKIKRNSPNKLRRTIEGSLSKQQVKDAFQWEEVSPRYTVLKHWIQNWIDGATEEQLENFLYAISGRTTLTDSTRLSAYLQGTDQLPSFSTCFFRMYLPFYSDEDTFNRKLNLSLLNIDQGNGIGLV